MDDRNSPATKGDLVDGLAQVRTELRTEIRATEERLVEAIRDNQTEVLKAFYNFAASNDKRLAQNEVNEVANRARIDTLERRVTELEQRLNIPPAA